MKSKYFTYGVEIEGLVKQSLITQLSTITNVRQERDGSVHAGTIFAGLNPSQQSDINTDVQEMSLGIFKSEKALLKALSLIDNTNHFWNTSCGMHLHIKPRRDRAYFETRLVDVDFLHKLQDFAFTKLCDHVKLRKNIHYCGNYQDLQGIRSEWRTNEKYRFIRNHRQYNTYEMRFFSPCEHKVDNVKMFLAFLFKEINNVKPKKETTFILPAAKSSNLSMSFVVKDIKKPIEEVQAFKIESVARQDISLDRVETSYEVVRDQIRGAVRGTSPFTRDRRRRADTLDHNPF